MWVMFHEAAFSIRSIWSFSAKARKGGALADWSVAVFGCQVDLNKGF